MLSRRILTAAIGVPVIIGALVWGTLPWAILLAAIGVIMAHELIKIFAARGLEIPGAPVYLAPVLFCLMPVDLAAYGLDFTFAQTEATGTGLPLLILLLMALGSAVLVRAARFQVLLATLFAGLYTGFLLSRIVVLRDEPEGIILVLMLIVGVWVNDTAAYFVGRTWGRRKLAPLISPNKTIEGSIAGIIFGTAVAPLIILIDPGAIVLAGAIAFGIAVAVAAQAGDLFESAIKRSAGVKDSGNILPGHGGLLDRFDSLLFAGPAAYYIVRLF